MEIIDLNVKAYKKQSPLRIVIIFVLGVFVGFALFYIYSQINPPPKETPSPVPPVSQTSEEKKEEPIKPSESPIINEEQKLLSELESMAPLIYILDENKFSDSTINMLKQIRPFAILVKPAQGTLDKNKFLSLLQNIRDGIRNSNSDLPLFAMNLDLNLLKSFPEFQDLPKLSDFNTNTETAKITEAGTLYAKNIREWGISMFFGPMIELYVPGRVPETEKANYIGETTEAIQWIGLSFGQGLWEGKVIPVTKSFPSKTLALKKEIDGKINIALEVDNPGGDINQAISQLATWLFPFSEAVHQNLPALLVSHVSIPLLDDENPYLPASVSQKIIYGLIRGKWGYDGILIADDIAEYPLNGNATYTDIALQMTGVGIDLICISLEDANEISQIINTIEQNISKEAKEERCMKLAKLVSAVCPLPKKEIKDTTPSSESPLIARQQELPIPESQEVTPPPPPEIPPTKTVDTPKPPESVPPPAEEITPPEIPQKETTPTDRNTESSAPQMASTAPAETKSTEKSVAQDLVQIATEAIPPKAEKPPETSQQIIKEETKAEQEKKPSQKEPQPPGTKAINHKIARGETLYNIAQRYQVKPKDLMAWNGIQDPNLIKYGFSLVVYIPQDMEISQPRQKPQTQQEKPTPPTTEIPAITPITLPKTVSSDTTNTQPQPSSEPVEEKPKNEESQIQEKNNTSPTKETIIYTVKYGDTLDSIARDMRVTKEEIIQINNLKKPYLLPAGRKLKIPHVPKVGFN